MECITCTKRVAGHQFFREGAKFVRWLDFLPLRDGLMQLPEFKPLAALLKRSARGLAFNGKTINEARRLITQKSPASSGISTEAREESSR